MRPDQPPSNQPPSTSLKPKTLANEGRLSDKKVVAIKFAAEAGRKIQEACPNIAVDYINGLTLHELIVKYQIIKDFNMTNLFTARAAVWNAIHGYPGKLSTTYTGLITDKEILQLIAKKHQQSGSSKVGSLMRARGTGIFGMTEEAKSQIRKTNGENLYNAKKGIHAHTAEERKEISRKGVIGRGIIPLSLDEEAFLKGLDLENEQYRTRGKEINVTKITKEVNERFHSGNSTRNNNAIGAFLRKIKKSVIKS